VSASTSIEKCSELYYESSIFRASAVCRYNTGWCDPQSGGGANSVTTEADEDELAREVDDPTAILAQLKFQDLYTPQNFSTAAQTNEFQSRLVLPIQAFSLFPFQQVIRPTVSLKTLATSAGGSTITEFTDMQLFDLFVSNWPDPRETGFGWAFGPTFVFPTGRVSRAGSHAWQAGPAAAAIYRGIPRLLLGFLWQEPMSFAYTNSSATPQSQFQFQPLISYSLGRGWYVKSADSTWTINWRHNSSTTIPISLGLGKNTGNRRWSRYQPVGLIRLDSLSPVRRYYSKIHYSLRTDVVVPAA
jgi:hypothetical protein